MKMNALVEVTSHINRCSRIRRRDGTMDIHTFQYRHPHIPNIAWHYCAARVAVWKVRVRGDIGAKFHVFAIPVLEINDGENVFSKTYRFRSNIEFGAFSCHMNVFLIFVVVQNREDRLGAI